VAVPTVPINAVAVGIIIVVVVIVVDRLLFHVIIMTIAIDNIAANECFFCSSDGESAPKNSGLMMSLLVSFT
jgi:uncharacterized membrane protein